MKSTTKNLLILLLIISNLLTLGYVCYLIRYRARAVSERLVSYPSAKNKNLKKTKKESCNPTGLKKLLKIVPNFIIPEDESCVEIEKRDSEELIQQNLKAPDGILKNKGNLPENGLIVKIHNLGVLKDVEEDVKESEFQQKHLTNLILDKNKFKPSPVYLYNNGRIKIDGSTNSPKADPLVSSKEKINLSGSISVNF